MKKKFVIFIFLFSIIHFILTMITIYNGFIIFRSPSTPSEIFWDGAMNVMLFPANIISWGSASEWIQTLIIIINSLFWGVLITGLYLQLRKWIKSKITIS